MAIDTNVLVYAEGLNDDGRRNQARNVLRRIPDGKGVVPVQVLGELFQLLRRKGKLTKAAARASVEQWRAVFGVHPTTVAAFDAAVEISERHGLQIWDGVILAASAEAGCTILISEDMQSGFVWRGLTIVSPFDEPPHPLLTAALRPNPA